MVLRRRLVAILVVALGCAEPPLGPSIPIDDFQLPEPDLSLDPERIRTGDIIATECAFGIRGDGLAHMRGVYEWITVDVLLGPGTAVGPSTADRERLEDHGVRVLYDFNVRAVRGRVLVNDIPDLVSGVRGGIVVRDVPDARRYDVPSMIVRFSPPLGASHASAFRDLGGRIDNEMERLSMISGALPDQSIPDMRARSDVRFVEAGGVWCLAG